VKPSKCEDPELSFEFKSEKFLDGSGLQVLVVTERFASKNKYDHVKIIRGGVEQNDALLRTEKFSSVPQSRGGGVEGDSSRAPFRAWHVLTG